MVKRRYAIVVIFCIFIFIFGFLTVSSNLPKFVKDKSKFKINFCVYPFNLEIYTGKYYIYANSKAIMNIAGDSKIIINNFEEKITGAYEYINNSVVK